MDHYLLELTAGNLALRETMKAIRGRPQAVLMVEFSGDDEKEVADRVEKLHRRLEGVAGLTAAVPALEPAVRDPLWDLRKRRHAAAVRDARRPQAGDVRRGLRRGAGAAAGVRRPLPRDAAAATAPTAPFTATPASAACTSARC